MNPRAAHEPLWLTEARYRAIVEDQPDLVCRFLPDGTLTFANAAYCAFFGVRREDIIGRPYQPVVHPDDLADVQAQVASLSPTNPVVFIENRVFRGDGEERWTEWTNRAIYDDQGRLLEFQSAGRDVTERKRAEERTARLAAIVASADVAIYSTTLEGTITSWNRAAERMFGYGADEAIGQPIGLIIPAGGPADGLDIAERVGRGETIQHVETQKRTRDGELIPISLTVSPIIDTKGRVIGISRIARDITDRKRTERELQERESRFRLMADHAPVLIWMADVANAGVYFNTPWLDFTGVPAEAQVGTGWLSLIHPDDRPRASAYCQEHFDRRLPFTMEFRLRHHTGEYRWVLDSGRPLFLPDGTFHGYIGSCLDIHERKAAEDRVRSIVEGISDAFMAVDREWRFTYVNDQYLTLTSKSREELMGRVCWSVFPDAQRLAAYDVAHQAMRDQQPARHEDHYEPLDLWFEMRLYPTPDGLIWFITDISERKRLEAAQELAVRRESEARAAAEEASRLKDEFLAIVSHELRTPLNAMLGWTQMLREGSLGPGAVPKALDTIERNARMQAQLIDDLLDVSRMTGGHLSLRTESVSVGEVVRAALDAVRPAASNKGIELQARVPDEVVTVTGDPGRLQQAVWNLLSNAIKFTPKKGRIDVTVAARQGDAVVTVQDTGIGIPPEALPVIFDRFRQADSRTTRAHGGLGLGLAIVEHIAHAHGGLIRASSAGPGRGATFELALPLRAQQVDPVPPPQAPEVRPDLSGRRILVLDDDRDAVDVVRAILEACGAVVTAAGSVAEAIALAGTAAPELVIGDIGLPGQDGYDFIRLLRGMEQHRATPAVALTAYADERHRAAVLRAGFNAHVGKPVDAPALRTTVIDLLCGRWPPAVT